MSQSGRADVLVIRSGRTAWEEAGRIQGSADLPMSNSARAGAAAAVHHLSGSGRLSGIDTVVSAPDEASVEVAGLVAGALGKKVKTLSGLRAMGLGLWEGQLESELEDRHQSSFRAWRTDPSSVRPPEGEPFGEAEARIRAAVAKLADKHMGKGVAMVLRPMEFGIVLAAVRGAPMRELWGLIESCPLSDRFSVSPETIRGAAPVAPARASA